MTQMLLKYLCEPITKLPLRLEDAILFADGTVKSGYLVSPSGKSYKIVDGVPRFVDNVSSKTVESFGDEWNHFNFTDFKLNWLEHTVKNTFGDTSAFSGKIIVDAGGGSGAQSKWFSEFGAKHVIMMDLSHSVDGVAKKNLAGLSNVDVIQCSIDSPPLLDNSIDGIVYCHNVIQHTPSVEKTAKALFNLTATGGEFVFNCYPLNDKGYLRWIRFHMIYKPLRNAISSLPFTGIMAYARLMALLRLVPGLGLFLEKACICVMGDVPKIIGESAYKYNLRCFRTTVLNTFDGFGSHAYQHHKSENEIRAIVKSLQADEKKVLNISEYFKRPQRIGCALRVFR